MNNEHIKKYTAKLDTFMKDYPTLTFYETFKKAETKTGYPASVFFALSIFLAVGLILVVGGVKLLVDVVAFAYPAYMSFKALETSTSVDDKQWLSYWVAVSALFIAESCFGFIVFLIPMYYWLKMIVVVWMWHPTTRGAQTIYDQVLQPNLAPYLSPGTSKKAE